MPRRCDIPKIAVLGAGPITIGQACEFDYSGTQACQALREEGYAVLLINSNPATIMTDPSVATSTYIEPLNCGTVTKILQKERPNAILATMGGQTALNCLRELSRTKVLRDLDVETIGVTPEAIEDSESRARFKVVLKDSSVGFAISKPVRSAAEAKAALKMIESTTGKSFPVIIRPSFTLGGFGGGIANNSAEFDAICDVGLKASPTGEILVEESLLGWKEYELEVIKDSQDNCIAVCTIENIDPMGVHTGDSATVAPAQTLTDQEHQFLRQSAFQVVRDLRVVAGCVNVQFALCPQSGRLVVVEMNPRVSRSSALASKATGFPIARVSAKLAVGYTLGELRNRITECHLTASFEPTLDYVVIKLPKFSFEKFPEVEPILTTQMQSVGEAMGISRTFGGALRKAIRSLDAFSKLTWKDLRLDELMMLASYPSADRLFLLVEAFKRHVSLDLIFELTCVDRWFLHHLRVVANAEQYHVPKARRSMCRRELFVSKQQGLDDCYFVGVWHISLDLVTWRRRNKHVKPTFCRIDTCAAEFQVPTAYLYSSYEEWCEAVPSSNKKVLVLGSGPNRIGQGLEFDYCCVHSALALTQSDHESIMVNCNPETVSTDYDVPDKLFFEPLTIEDVSEVIQCEKPLGVIVQFGGQTPLKLAMLLEKQGLKLLGTNNRAIEDTEDRTRFKTALDSTTVKQPDNCIVQSLEQVTSVAADIGLPVIVRPSFVLGGSFMRIIRTTGKLKSYAGEAKGIISGGLLVERFLEDATECDIDCLCSKADVWVTGIMEHVEQAGVHSGDSACSLPSRSINQNTLTNLRAQAKELAKHLKIVGLMNVQFAAQGVGTRNEEVFVLEVNPRASRTVPYVSKTIGSPVAQLATKIMLDGRLSAKKQEQNCNLCAVKEAVFPFAKFPNSDCLLGPEMRSTGEVMGVGKSFGEAWSKAQMAVNLVVPNHVGVVLLASDADKIGFLQVVRWSAFLGLSVRSAANVVSLTKSKGLATTSAVRLTSHELLVSVSESDFDARRAAQNVGMSYCSTVRGTLAFVEGYPELKSLKVVRSQANC